MPFVIMIHLIYNLPQTDFQLFVILLWKGFIVYCVKNLFLFVDHFCHSSFGPCYLSWYFLVSFCVYFSEDIVGYLLRILHQSKYTVSLAWILALAVWWFLLFSKLRVLISFLIFSTVSNLSFCSATPLNYFDWCRSMVYFRNLGCFFSSSKCVIPG